MARSMSLMVLVLGLTIVGAAAQTGSAPAREVRLLVGDQSVFEPGFAVGDISVGDPAVADFRVRPGRRSVLLVGVGEGRTKLIVWDQRNQSRSEVDLVVETREKAEAESKLRALLRDFPSVKVERMAGDLVVTGAISSEDDLALIERMAASTGAESFVRYVPPVPPAGRAATPAPAGSSAPARPTAPVRPSAPMPEAAPPPARPAPAAPMPAPATPAAPAPEAPAPDEPAALEIEYEVQVMEASIAFGSSSYETGVEPSGRVLYSARIRTPLGGDAQTFVPGKSVASSDIKIPSKELPTSGIRVTLTPTALEDRLLSTRILVETNLPIKSSAYVPGGWRRARWQSDNDVAAPFSVAGADLLVVPELSSGGGTLSSIAGAAGTLSGLPGLSSVPGAGYAGYVPYYNKSRKTHLLLLVRSRAIAPGR